MGTDIYLKWDGQTKAEKNKQYTGFDIGSGNVGYMRASIGMIKENAVLREVFPSEFWASGKPTAYDFKANFAILNTIAKKYLSSAMFGIPIEVGNGQRKQLEMTKTLALFLAKKDFDKVLVSTNDGIESEVMWINSLYAFFRLGLEKQEKGLNPKVYISW